MLVFALALVHIHSFFVHCSFSLVHVQFFTHFVRFSYIFTSFRTSSRTHIVRFHILLVFRTDYRFHTDSLVFVQICSFFVHVLVFALVFVHILVFTHCSYSFRSYSFQVTSYEHEQVVQTRFTQQVSFTQFYVSFTHGLHRFYTYVWWDCVWSRVGVCVEFVEIME